MDIVQPGRVDEPQATIDYSEVFSQVASQRRPVIVCRNGADLAAVVPMEHLDLLKDALARQEAEKLAARIDWDKVVMTCPPAQEWFNGDEPKPF